MNVASMNERITFQRQAVSVDEIGNRINTWSDYFSCWAAVSSASRVNASEKDEAAQTLEQNRLNFTVRRCSQTSVITSTEYRIIFRERIYNISNVDSVKKQSLKFTANLVRR